MGSVSDLEFSNRGLASKEDKKSKSIEDHALEAARLVREKREIKKEIDSVRKEVPVQVAEVRVTNEPDMVEREYSSYAMTDEEFRKFREKEMEQRKKKFVQEQGPFDRYDDVGSEFKDWEGKNYPYSVFPDPPTKPNPVLAYPASNQRHGALKRRVDSSGPVDREKVEGVAEHLLEVRIVDRLVYGENEESEACARLENQRTSAQTLENKSSEMEDHS
jgi:hypothetical protein